MIKMIILAVMLACTTPELVETNVMPKVQEVIAAEPKTETESKAKPPFDELVEMAMNDLQITEEDIELMALVTMAEAEGEPEEGQRLVIDTFLNRMEHPYFPDTIYDVIWQPGQYVCMTNGRTSRCYVKDELVQLVKEELVSRTNYDVIYFSAGGYSNFGTPVVMIGNHGFTSY